MTTETMPRPVPLQRRLEGRRTVITGGCSGIGRACGELLADWGARVAVVDIDRDQLAACPETWATRQADLRDPAAVRTAFDALHAELGGIELLINCAGVSRWKPLLEMDEAFWDATFDVNCKGTFLACQAAARHMCERGDGLIINVASMSAVKSGMPAASAYAASKWAVIGFSRNLHLELKPHGVRVAAICPGSTRTPLHEQAGTERLDEMLEPSEIAEAIAFMASAPANGHVQLLCMPAMYEDWR